MPKAEVATYALLIITAIVLAALKLTGIAKISWAIALFPIWGPIFIERRNP